MQVIKTKFSGLIIYKRKTHRDNRGFFRELFLNTVIKKNFVFDCYSISKKNVIRGIHLQLKKPQGKLITVLSGKIFDVALDCRPNSRTFGKVFSIQLSEKDNTSIYIPEGFGHGFCSLSNNTLLHYKCTSHRDKKSETGIYYRDKNINIKWPEEKMIVSKKDKNCMTFADFIKSKKFRKFIREYFE